MIKWNSVKIIPKYDEHYLVYTKSGHMHTIYYWADSWDNFIRPRPNGATITHWAKLPPPPTSDNSEYMAPSAQLKKLAENQKSLTPEMIDVINDNFWELF